MPRELHIGRRPPARPFPSAPGPCAALLAAVLTCLACREPPQAPTAPEPMGPAGPLPAADGAGLTWPRGAWRWTWTDSIGGRGGPARLEVTSDGWSWSFPGPPPPPRASVRLEPERADTWEPFTVAVPDPDASPAAQWLPLPRVPLTAAAYPGLVSLAAALTGPRFGSRVTHWPSRPVPVRAGAAVSGTIDLAACLADAMAAWNAGTAPPWFAADDTAAWGVRLVHLAGRRLSPPAWCQITRLDDEGRPLRVNIVVGDNWDDARDSTYAARALAHELGHALFLWGHSVEREHLLWGAAPPLVDGPSPDERKAALLWHGLPEGLDLGRYGPVIPP